MKKLILLLSLLLCSLLVFAACNKAGGDPNHTHAWSEWKETTPPDGCTDGEIAKDGTVTMYAAQ